MVARIRIGNLHWDIRNRYGEYETNTFRPAHTERQFHYLDRFQRLGTFPQWVLHVVFGLPLSFFKSLYSGSPKKTALVQVTATSPDFSPH